MIYICGVLLQILETVGKSPKDHSTYDLYKIHKVKWTPYLEHSVSQTSLEFEQKRVQSLINIEILIHLKRFTTFFVPTNSRQVSGVTPSDFRKAQSTPPKLGLNWRKEFLLESFFCSEILYTEAVVQRCSVKKMF